MTGASGYKKWAWIFHVLFWVAFSLLSYLIYSIVIEDPIHALLPTAVNLVGLSVMVYLHVYFLLPKFFERQKYVLYFSALIILIFLSSVFRFYVGLALNRFWALSYEPFFTPTFFGSMIASSSFVLVLSPPLYLVENWFEKFFLKNELKAQQLGAELRFLKAQVNPHFLFNALNNIYSLAFMQSQKTPEMILKLSGMMSYMLYECDQEQVELASEIAYINNYIDLQQLKKDGEQNIDFTVIGTYEGYMIAPMLFIPFFENVFKHGNLSDTRQGWMRSHMNVQESRIDFTIENSYNNNDFKKQLGGVGLENIKQRLSLIYPEQHQLSIQVKEAVFSVELIISLVNQKYEVSMFDR